MASHFIRALHIPGLMKAKQDLHSPPTHDDDPLDIDISLTAEASEDDIDAIHEASITDFDAGNTIGKLMAFIAQLRLCSEGTREFLKDLCVSGGGPAWEIKLWVRTRWGSLSDCFQTVLAKRKASCHHCFVIDLVLIFSRVLIPFVDLPMIARIYLLYRTARNGLTTSSRPLSGRSSSLLKIVSE